MQERLVEIWLDSVSELAYQAPLCQVLLARGENVLHSTRHMPIEFGKDIISVAPDGVPCAYQLKGNPSGRLTLRQFRDEIQSQLFMLATQAIVFPGCPTGPHRPFLVTNGQVDEEVQRAIDDMNRMLPAGFHPVTIIARGTLLSWFCGQASEFWPSEIDDLGALLRTLAMTGRELPPVLELDKLLRSALLLDDGNEPSKAAVDRRVASAAVLVSIAIRSFSVAKNHYAVCMAWVMFAVYALCACERYGVKARGVAASIDLAEFAAFASLSSLVEEAAQGDGVVVDSPLVDAVLFRGRTTLLVGLASCLWLWCEVAGAAWPSPTLRADAERFLRQTRTNVTLWGEGAIPQVLSHIWFLQRSDATPQGDWNMVQLCDAVCGRAVEPQSGIASPYYSFEDVMRHVLAPRLGWSDPLADETARGTSSFSEGLYHLVVRTGLKGEAKALWSKFSRVGSRVFELEANWHYCFWRRHDDGREATRFPPLTDTWDNVVLQSRNVATPEIPGSLRDRPLMLLLFVILAPHRATPNVVRFLGHRFGTYWLREAPIS